MSADCPVLNLLTERATQVDNRTQLQRKKCRGWLCQLDRLQNAVEAIDCDRTDH